MSETKAAELRTYTYEELAGHDVYELGRIYNERTARGDLGEGTLRLLQVRLKRSDPTVCDGDVRVRPAVPKDTGDLAEEGCSTIVGDMRVAKHGEFPG